MRRPVPILVALVLASVCTGVAEAAQDPARTAAAPAAAQRFDAWVEQDGERQPFQGEVHLKQAPFSFVFRGDPAFIYSVGASLDPHKLENKTTPDDLKAVFAPGSAVAEGQRDTFLAVNADQPTPYEQMRMHYWGDAPGGRFHRFKSVTVDNFGLATSVREIDSLFLSAETGFVEIPIGRFGSEKIFVLVAGRPPFPGRGKEQGFFDPKYVTLVFDRR
jgi:hypothetical protein